MAKMVLRIRVVTADVAQFIMIENYNELNDISIKKFANKTLPRASNDLFLTLIWMGF